MKNLTKTLIFTLILCSICASVSVYVQLDGWEKVGIKCSYLDPVLIDLLAFLFAIFLIIEGIARIIEHHQASLRRQLTRSIRIAIGISIVTIHIMQFIHK